jgi:hypothetical protein
MLGMFIETRNEWKGVKTTQERSVLGWKSFVKASEL